MQTELKQSQTALSKTERVTNELSFMKSKLNNNSEIKSDYDKVIKKLNQEKEKNKTLLDQLFSVKNELESQKAIKIQGVPDDVFELKSKFIESESRNKNLLKEIIGLKA